MLDAFAGHKQFAIQRGASFTGAGRHKQLRERWHHMARARAQARRLNRHFAPAEGVEAFVAQNCFDCGFGVRCMRCVGWQKRHAHAIGTSRWQRNASHFAQKLVGHLQQNARAIPCFGFGTGGTAVLHAAQGTQPGLHDAMAGYALDVHHKRHAARVVLEAWVI